MKRISVSHYAWVMLAVGICSLSLYVNGLFWWGMGDSLLFQALYTSMGLLFDVAKILSLPLSLVLWGRGKKVTSLMAFGMFLLLAMVSMLSNISVLQAQVKMKGQNELSQSKQYALIATEIQHQQSTIALIQELIHKDTEQGYRARAISMAPELENAQRTLSGLIQKQQTLQAGSAHSKNILERDWLIIFLGCLLEVVTAFVLFALRQHAEINVSDHKIDLQDIKKSEPSSGVKASAKLKIVSLGGKLVKPRRHPESNIDLKEVQELIARNKLKPTTRALRERFKVGSKSACDILKSLEKQGFLVAQSRGYALAS